ncbi:MAG: C10 family peptidase [Bacteroidaceae bacterium]|nr:C10 family peptidase [Bacteroidaceae bacterium]
MRTTLLAIAILLSMTAYAGPVDIETAKQIAQEYLDKQKGTPKKIKQSSAPRRANSASGSDEALSYYAFDIEENGGFVIVSGDDQLKPILAHTDNGNFNPDSLNPAVQWWLGLVEKSVAIARENPEKAAATNYTLSTSVEPLVKTSWNQRSPYNNLCPYDSVHGGRSVTGCVATAMAQLLNYHKYPESATGTVSHTTTDHAFEINETLDNYIFDWDNMLNSYNSSATEEQQNAVARLMYACGAAANADYCVNATGTPVSKCISALKNNFGYKGVNYTQREVYTYDEWNSLVMTELDNARPIFYHGDSPSGGHAFICDGYNSDGLFHINWGWGGYQDGYFELAALEYCSGQGIIYGMSPDNQTEAGAIIDFSHFESPTETVYLRSRSSIPARLYKVKNSSATTFDGYFGIALTSNDEIVAYNHYSYTLTLNPAYYYSSLTFNLNIPTIPDGEYKMVGIYKETGSDEIKIMRGIAENGNLNHLIVTVKGDSAILSLPKEYEKATLEISNIEHPEVIYNGESTKFTLTLKNSTNSNFNGYVYIDDTDYFTGVNVPAQKEKEYTIYATMPSTGEFHDINIYSCNDIAGDTLIYTRQVELIPSGTAQDFESDGIYYKITSRTKQTVAVTHKGSSRSEYSNEYTGNVTIPATTTYNGNTYEVTSIGSGAFYFCTGLTGVTIPSSVKKIDSYAFYYCTGLAGVTIPSSVTNVSARAFYSCNKLADIHFNSNPSIVEGSIPSGTICHLALNDSEAADFDISNANTFADASYTRTITAGKYATIILPFEPDAASSNNYIFYELAESGNGYMKFSEVTTPVANTPYLYTLREGTDNIAITGDETTISPTIETPSIGGWETTGSFTNQKIDTSDGNYYAFSPAKNEVNRITKSLTVLPYRAYFKCSNASKSAYRIYIGGTTGIKEIAPEDIENFQDGTIFNIQGHRITEPVKGEIYIKNGKKIR